MMKMTFSLACSLVLGGAAVLSVSSCDKYDDKQSVRETPAAKQVDGQWQTPEETDALLADAGVTRVNEDYFKGKLPADSSSVIGGFVLNPSGLTVEASTSGKETRLACTVTGTTLSLADVTPQDSTFYEVNAQYGWKKEVKYKNFEYPKSAIVSGTSGLTVNGVDASGQLHDLSAQTMLVTTTPRTLIEWRKGSNRKPVGIHLDFIDSDYFKWLDARFTLVLPTETVNKYAAVKVTLKNKESAPVEQVWKRG